MTPITEQEVLDAMKRPEIVAGPAYLAASLTNGESKIPPHINLLNDELIRCSIVPNQRVIVSLPPGSGKSQLISKWNLVHYLERFPHKKIALCGSTDTFAASWGRQVRNLVIEHQNQLTVRLSQDSQAADQWNTTKGGGMKAFGVGSGVIGFRFNMAVVDDPYGSVEDAQSQVVSDKIWDWFSGTLFSRMEPGASIIIVMARWNDLDIAGRILNQDKGRNRWRYIEIPAIAKDNDVLGRPKGAPLWPERFDLEALKEQREVMGSRVFDAQYQQETTSATGPIFQREWFRYYEDVGDHYLAVNPENPSRNRRILKSNCWRFMTCDTAMTEKTTSDYTVAQIWDVERQKDGAFMFLVDQWRKQATAPEVKTNLRNLNTRYKPLFIGIEDKVSGTTIIQDFINEGLNVKSLKAVGDKRSRAGTLEVRMENGKVFFPANAPWLDELEKELLVFTGNKDPRDDQVDVTAYSAIMARDNNMWQEPSQKQLPSNSLGKLLGFDKVFAPKERKQKIYARDW